MMTLGFLGCGAIGSAISDIHQDFGQRILRHDLNLKSKLSDLMDADIIFICLPTPQSKNGACNISLIEDELNKLNDMGFDKIIVMKSTVPAGTGMKLSEMFSFKYVSCPEFLREHNAKNDYLSQATHIIGCEEEIPTKLQDALAPLRSDLRKVTITEAELAKYFHNTYNAWRITFANAFCDLSDVFDTDYNNILEAFCTINDISSSYLRSSPEYKGFGGPCLPKDTAALAYLAKKLNLDSNIWDFMLNENLKRKVTLPPGLREVGFSAQKLK